MCSGQVTGGMPTKMARNFTSMGYAIGSPSGSLKSVVDRRILDIQKNRVKDLTLTKKEMKQRDKEIKKYRL